MDKIYFAGSIRAGREDAELYGSIIKYLGRYGQVLTEHVGSKDLPLHGEKGLTDRQIHDRDVKWPYESNIIVAEVTKASLGVGYEIGRIVERNLSLPEEQRKKILCLYRPQSDKKLSAMITGSAALQVVEYFSLKEAMDALDKFFISIKDKNPTKLKMRG